MASPAASLQSFDVNRDNSNTGPSTVATHLEALTSKLSFSPRRHHRRRHKHADGGHNLQSEQLPPSKAKSHRVRFEVNSEDEGLGARGRAAEPLQQLRNRGSSFAQEEDSFGRGQNKYADEETPLLHSCDSDGPRLLQVCVLRGALGHSPDREVTWGDSNRGTPPSLLSPFPEFSGETCITLKLSFHEVVGGAKNLFPVSRVVVAVVTGS